LTTTFAAARMAAENDPSRVSLGVDRMDDRDKIIAWIAERECKRIAGLVVRDLRRMTKGMQSGEDSGLRNLWDEVCVQVQGEESAMWDLYMETIGAMIKRHVDTAGVELTRAIWLQTENGSDWVSDSEIEHDADVEASAESSTELKIIRWVRALLIERAEQAGIDPGPLVEPLFEAEAEAARSLEEAKGGNRHVYDRAGGPEYSTEDIVDRILHNYVLRIAADWKNKRIERFLEKDHDFD